MASLGSELNETNLAQGFAELEALSQAEYALRLEDLVASTQDDETMGLAKIGRLIGVTMKRPFASPVDLDTPSAGTSALREWVLNMDSFADPALQQSWQYRTLERLKNDEFVIAEIGWSAPTVLDWALLAKTERGFFGNLLLNFRGVVCGDKRIRGEIEKTVEEVRRHVGPAPKVTPELIVGAGGMALGVHLVQSVPILGLVGAPVIAGLVLLIYTLNVDALCRTWSVEQSIGMADNEK